MRYIFILLFFLPLTILGCNKPHTHSIEKITFSTDGGMSRANNNLSIDSNRHAVYSYTTAMGERNGPLTGTVDKATFNKIVSDLEALDFPSLKDNYTENATDCSTYILTITYDNGKVKRIQDYCRQGPKGLLALYEELFILEDTQKWKK